MCPPFSASAPRPNHLIRETSPYLLQHAHNPVDWHPWGPAALALAKQQDRPIFLSIGYSACHWCHVMEHECFQNENIAALMNAHFINIKVDREERPDLDQIYMSAVQLLTQRGGWPMSVFLTPALKPFYGGTYWPPTSRMGMPGFQDVLQRVHSAWLKNRTDIDAQAEELTRAVIQLAEGDGSRTPLDDSHLKRAMQKLLSMADRQHGGFGHQPKFPHAIELRLLLRGWMRFGDGDALDVVKLTLDKMAGGGMYDQLGGGFHRYSTDERWLTPHFEKMLYDNALLVPAYLEAFQATGDENHARVARETLDYILREMEQPEGGYYSTQDADSEGEEGRFFVWTNDEVRSLLGADADLFCEYYDVAPSGNWEGRTILNAPHSLSTVAHRLGLPEAELSKTLTRCRRVLLEIREKRVKPGRDDKVLVAWNGMLISAMSQAALVLGESRYARSARRAADFILGRMRTENGELWHTFKDGRVSVAGFLDDYACLIDGLADLFQAGGDAADLTAALALADIMLEQFWDHESGGFYYTPRAHETLIARNKETYDGSTPSGNGMAATALLRLGRLGGRRDLEERAIETLSFVSAQMVRSPAACSQSLLALDFLLGPTQEIVLVDGTRPDESEEAWRGLFGRFWPNKVVARLQNSKDGESPATRSLLSGKSSLEDKPTFYVCRYGACALPTTDLSAVFRAAVEI